VGLQISRRLHSKYRRKVLYGELKRYRVDEVTRQNAAMVEETTAAASLPADDADELAGLVGRFKTSASREAWTRRRPRSPPKQPVDEVERHALLHE
jgi:hypothetical protein